MKKKRFSILAKIILLTGLLTILTVSLSLGVSLFVSYKNSEKFYVESCEAVTNSMENIFETKEKQEDIITKKDAARTFDWMIEKYEVIKDHYEELDAKQIYDYQFDLRESVFGPVDGKFGMTLDKSANKIYYTTSFEVVKEYCEAKNVPQALLWIYDKENKCILFGMDSSITLEQNLSTFGKRGPVLTEEAFDFITGKEHSKTEIVKGTIYSYNRIDDIPIANKNYSIYVQGQYPSEVYAKTFSKQAVATLLITTASSLLLVAVYALFAKFVLLKNVSRLTDSTHEFVGKMKNNEKLVAVETKISSNDEIGDLADEFNLMQSQIIDYVDKVKTAEAKEQAFNAEVNVASKIQLESLPAGTHFDRNLELRAFIKPAKGVGGDFYDYFYIDNDHLAFVIADVSGKGIPASLFMMRSREFIRSVSTSEDDLAKVFAKVNNSLCANNVEGFFVTAFLGILDMKKYEFRFINAGHERPLLLHDGKCERIKSNSNFVLGLEEDFVYEEEKIKFSEGDAILLYTDGLNEAINSKKEEFGYERLIESFGKNTEISAKIPGIIGDLEKFIGKEEQFDDITMLAFRVKKNVVSYHYIDPTYAEIDDLTDRVNACLSGIDPNLLSKIDVVIDEVMNNIISYGQTKAHKTLQVSIEKKENEIKMVFIDNSHPFNPLLKEKRTVQENMDQGIVGGLGISIVKSIAKEAEYAYSNNKNILVLKF